MARTCDALYKILLIGDSGVDKISIIVRFTKDNFSTAESTAISLIGKRSLSSYRYKLLGRS